MPQKRKRADNEWNQTVAEVRKKMKESGIKAPKLKDVLKEASAIYKVKRAEKVAPAPAPEAVPVPAVVVVTPVVDPAPAPVDLLPPPAPAVIVEVSLPVAEVEKKVEAL